MASQTPPKPPIVVDTVEAAKDAIQELRDTHGGLLGIDLEGDLTSTGKLSLGKAKTSTLSSC